MYSPSSRLGGVIVFVQRPNVHETVGLVGRGAAETVPLCPVVVGGHLNTPG